MELNSIAKSLSSADTGSPRYWPSVAQLINLQSKARAGHPIPAPQQVRAFRHCIQLSGKLIGGTVDQGGDYSCAVNLENADLSDSVIKNALVFFSGKTKLSNVRFMNCIFVTMLSADPPKPARKLAEILLAKDNESIADFKVTIS